MPGKVHPYLNSIQTVRDDDSVYNHVVFTMTYLLKCDSPYFDALIFNKLPMDKKKLMNVEASAEIEENIAKIKNALLS